MPDQGLGLEDTRPVVRVTCVDCRTEGQKQVTQTLDPRWLMAWCSKCKRRTVHVR